MLLLREKKGPVVLADILSFFLIYRTLSGILTEDYRMGGRSSLLDSHANGPYASKGLLKLRYFSGLCQEFWCERAYFLKGGEGEGSKGAYNRREPLLGFLSNQCYSPRLLLFLAAVLSRTESYL